MAQWRSGVVARWRGGAVARWRGGAVARWRGGAVARWVELKTTQIRVMCCRAKHLSGSSG